MELIYEYENEFNFINIKISTYYKQINAQKYIWIIVQLFIHYKDVYTYNSWLIDLTCLHAK